ncbi:MAG: PAS domain S-box protein, partial [Candidatus Thorarchaeota archaeon]
MISNNKKFNVEPSSLLSSLIEIFNGLFVIIQPNDNYKIEFITNNEFLKVLGHSYNSLFGNSVLNLIVPEDIEKAKEFLINKVTSYNGMVELRIRNISGNNKWVKISKSKIKDKNSEDRFLLYLTDITKQKELELKLEESKVIFQTAIESMPFDVFVINREGRYIMQNSICRENWGNIIGKHPEDVANDKDTLALWRDNNKRAFSGEIVTDEVSFEINGEIRYLYNIISPICIDNEINNILGVNIDITERKWAEEKIRESEKKYKDMINNLDIGFFRVGLDGTLLNHNPKFNEIFGILHNETIVGTKPYDFWYHDEDREKFLKELKKNGYVKNYLTQAKKINGEKIIIQSNSHLIKNQNGFPIATEGTIIDITEKYFLEQKLKNSKERYQDLVELLPDVIYEADLNLNLTYANSIAFEKFGYTQDDLNSGLKIVQLIDPEYKEKAFSKIKLIFKGKKTDPEEYLLRKKDGSCFYARIHSRPIFENGKIIGLRGTINDINEMVLKEQELKESEEKFRSIAEQSLMGICIIQDFEIKYLNQQMVDIYGYHLNEAKSWEPKEFIKVIHPDNKKMVIDQIKKKKKASTNIKTQYIAKIITKNGNIRWVENYSTSIIYQGKPAELLTQIDITSKMEAENKIRISEKKYRHLYESSPYAILMINIRGDILDCNYRSEELSGFKRNELVGKNFQEIHFIPKRYLQSALEDFKTLVKGENIESREIQLYRKDGTLAWVTYQASTFHIENEIIIQVLIQDITKRKKVDQKVIESEEKYHNLFETSPNGVILSDLSGYILECNSSLEKIIGYSVEDIIGKNFMSFNIYEENALEILKKGFKDLIGNQKLEYIEFPIKHKDNHRIWIRISSSLITMKTKTYILAVIYDITTQKIAEEALKRSEEKYRDLLETSSIGVLEFDLINEKLTYINPKLLDIIDYRKEDLTEEIFLNKIIYQKDLTKLLKSNEESEIEFRIFDKASRLKWLAGKRIPNFDENGEIVSIRIWLDDI